MLGGKLVKFNKHSAKLYECVANRNKTLNFVFNVLRLYLQSV